MTASATPPRTMRGLVAPEAGRLEVRELPVPTPGPYEALVRIECCGICNSTDWKVVRGQMEWAGPFPLVLGHESVGVVEAVGSRVRRFRVGDRVTRPVVPRRPQGINSAFGGFSEYGIVTDGEAMAVDGRPEMRTDYNAQRQNVAPEHLSPTDAALTISLAETASVLASLPNLHGRHVLVVGTGVAGIALSLWCKLAGAWVATVGRREERLRLAKQIAADAVIDARAGDIASAIRELGPITVAIDAVGEPGLAAAISTALPAEAVLSAYGAPPTGQRYDDRWTTADVREQDAYPWVADLIRRGVVRTDWFVTHTWELDEAASAFEAVARGDVLKGFVRMSGQRS